MRPEHRLFTIPLRLHSLAKRLSSFSAAYPPKVVTLFVFRVSICHVFRLRRPNMRPEHWLYTILRRMTDEGISRFARQTSSSFSAFHPRKLVSIAMKLDRYAQAGR
jgi:hypothetical protein